VTATIATIHPLSKVITTPFSQTGLIIVLGLGLLLPLGPLTHSPLHHDEALYIYWGQLVASGRDPLLNTVAVDKPPLFIYTLAIFFKLFGFSDTVARLPSMLAHFAIIGLSFGLGRNLYGRQTGLLSALIVTLSPFSILFAPTALTDPMMVAWVLLAAWAATEQKPLWVGLGLGLAAATKQQGIFFAPLIFGLLFLCHPPISTTTNKETPTLQNRSRPISQALLVYIIVLTLPLIWDLNRTYRPGFWLQSAASYGGLSSAVTQFPTRWDSFVQLLTFITGSQTLNTVFLFGLPLIFLTKPMATRIQSQSNIDWFLGGFCLIFVGLHAAFSFQVWDRYLLGLVPLAGLLLARILLLPQRIIHARQIPHQATVIAGLLPFGVAIWLMAAPVQQAVNTAYPLGADHGAFYGTDQVAAYLRQHAGANVTLYHRWLGGHWRAYLFNFPYDFRFWQSADDLARQAVANATGRQYIAFPAWQSTTPAELALFEQGLALHSVFKTIRPDGNPAISLYQIEAIE